MFYHVVATMSQKGKYKMLKLVFQKLKKLHDSCLSEQNRMDLKQCFPTLVSSLLLVCTTIVQQNNISNYMKVLINLNRRV